MPKMKTHKGAQKRFRVTKNGKLLRRKQGGNHLRRKKRKVSDYRHKITSTNGSQIKIGRRASYIVRHEDSTDGTFQTEGLCAQAP